jgi:prepilin-type N-terminal cleavage/methylation domain-containing protein
VKSTTPRSTEGFTLLELLVVIAIIGIIAAIAAPTMNTFKPNVAAAASRQLLDDISRARQLAISQRTTVYMIFVPPDYWTDPTYVNLDPQTKEEGKKLFDRQFTGYTFVSLRSLGDQPGRAVPKYLAPWKTLPEGVYISPLKFLPATQSFNVSTNTELQRFVAHRVFGFYRTDRVPFPTAGTPRSPTGRYPAVPYIAFNYLGGLDTRPQRDEVIPLTRGSILYPRDAATRTVLQGSPSLAENPAGNTTNSYNVIIVDWLTGRGRIERQEVR